MSCRVLIVEDDPDIREAIAEILAAEGYEIRAAGDPRAALAALPWRPQLVVSDFGLGGDLASSYALLEELAARVAPAPVGVITGWDLPLEEIERRGLAFLRRKPFSAEDLLEAVATHVAREPLAAGAERAIRGYFSALERGDWEALGALCTGDVLYHLPGQDPRFCQTIRGRAAFQAFSRDTFAGFPEVRFSVRTIVSLPSGAIARYQARWRGPGGAPVETDGAVLLHFEGGAIARIGVRADLRGLTALAAR